MAFVRRPRYLENTDAITPHGLQLLLVLEHLSQGTPDLQDTELVDDIEKLNTETKKHGAKEIYSKLDSKNVRHINFAEWSQIDTKEIEHGEPKGKPREKYTSIGEMLSVIK